MYLLPFICDFKDSGIKRLSISSDLISLDEKYLRGFSLSAFFKSTRIAEAEKILTTIIAAFDILVIAGIAISKPTSLLLFGAKIYVTVRRIRRPCNYCGVGSKYDIIVQHHDDLPIVS